MLGTHIRYQRIFPLVRLSIPSSVTHNIEEMKEYLKSALIVILPIIFWFCILATGYGAQSLSQLIEIPIVLVASITIAYYLKNQNIYKIIRAIFCLYYY